jgi:hypothetical protein
MKGSSRRSHALSPDKRGAARVESFHSKLAVITAVVLSFARDIMT